MRKRLTDLIPTILDFLVSIHSCPEKQVHKFILWAQDQTGRSTAFFIAFQFLLIMSWDMAGVYAELQWILATPNELWSYKNLNAWMNIVVPIAIIPLVAGIIYRFMMLDSVISNEKRGWARGISVLREILLRPTMRRGWALFATCEMGLIVFKTCVLLFWKKDIGLWQIHFLQFSLASQWTTLLLVYTATTPNRRPDERKREVPSGQTARARI